MMGQNGESCCFPSGILAELSNIVGDNMVLAYMGQEKKQHWTT